MVNVKSATPELQTPPPYCENEYEPNNSNNYNYSSTLSDLKTRNLKENVGFYLDGKFIKIKNKAVLFDSDGHIKLQDLEQIYDYTPELSKLW